MVTVTHAHFSQLGNLIQSLSIDVTVGSVVFSQAIAKTLGVDLPHSCSFTLAGSVWSIYTLDHLIDAQQIKGIPSLFRHSLHQKHKVLLIAAIVLVSIINLWQVTRLPYIVTCYGVLLLSLVGIYFFLLWRCGAKFIKEGFVAVLYGCGVFLSSTALSSDIGYAELLLFAQTIIMAFINLLLFSYFEISSDTLDGSTSWVTRFGKPKTNNHLIVCFGWMILLIGIGFFSFHASPLYLILQCTFLSMAVILFLIYEYQDFFIRYNRFRWVGDAVFLLPLLIWLF